MERHVEILAATAGTVEGPSKRKIARVTCTQCKAHRDLYVNVGSGRDTKAAQQDAAQFFIAHGWTNSGAKYTPLCPDCRRNKPTMRHEGL